MGRRFTTSYANSHADHEEDGEPLLAHAVANLQDVGAKLDYQHGYFGCTEPSDVVMDPRTFTMPDPHIVWRRNDSGPGMDAEIYDDPMFRLFVEDRWRGPPYPEPDQEPGISPVWTTMFTTQFPSQRNPLHTLVEFESR